MVFGLPIRRRDCSIRAYALVDYEDFLRFNRYRWHLNEDGYVQRQEGARGERMRKIQLHREILGLVDFDGICVDHVNGDTLDNRRANVRVATRAENNQNRRRRGGTSRYRGVSWNAQRQKWAAAGGVDGRVQYLGLFDSEQDAAQAAREWRREHLPFAVER